MAWKYFLKQNYLYHRGCAAGERLRCAMHYLKSKCNYSGSSEMYLLPMTNATNNRKFHCCLGRHMPSHSFGNWEAGQIPNHYVANCNLSSCYDMSENFSEGCCWPFRDPIHLSNIAASVHITSQHPPLIHILAIHDPWRWKQFTLCTYCVVRYPGCCHF